jgi:serine/threonine protein kinase
MNTPITSFKTASSSLPVGTRLAEFEITGVIGEGGFGIVYSAHDSSLERIVAIKEYLPSAFAQRGGDGTVQVKSEEHRKTFTAGLSSFINEARMLAKFSHPGLVEVFRFWEANSTAYMAMRYYRGVTLREMLRTSPQLVTEQWLCETLDPILLALKELHNEKCFHRDIAPDNILVLPNGRSVLMDFGAARRIISGMTQALTTVLKPGYAPIEQYYDDGSMQQGAWTDIYAVGGLLYHLMTGKVPVQAISRMISDPLKPVADVAAGDFSARLCNVVMTCLAVMPENRYQSVDELRTALGWVTTPVISTVIHKPQIAEPPNEYPATVVMSASAAQRAVLAEVVAQPVSPPSPEPAAMGLGSDPDATVISSRARHASPVESFSIDELINAPSAPPAAPAAPKAAIDSAPAPAAKVAPQTRPPQVSTQAKPADAPRSSASGSRMPVIVGALAALGVLGAAGLFMFGSPKTPEPELAITKPEPAPVVVKPADEAAASPSAPVAVAAAAVSEPQAAPAPTQQAAIAPSGVASAAIGASSSALVDTNGSVRVELKGGWGVVFVDGEQKGTVPPVLVMKLAPGSHDLEIRNPAVPTEKRVITVSAGKTTVVRHAFVK